MSKENIENKTRSDSNFVPTFVDPQVLSDIHFNGCYLINNNIYILKKVIILYISYILSPWLRILYTDSLLKNCLHGSVKVTNNAAPDKYRCSCYSIGFDSRSEF